MKKLSVHEDYNELTSINRTHYSFNNVLLCVVYYDCNNGACELECYGVKVDEQCHENYIDNMILYCIKSKKLQEMAMDYFSENIPNEPQEIVEKFNKFIELDALNID